MRFCVDRYRENEMEYVNSHQRIRSSVVGVKSTGGAKVVGSFVLNEIMHKSLSRSGFIVTI